jgi:hypothetical protein
MKRVLIAVIVVFVLVEGWLVTRAPSFGESLSRGFSEPATLLVLVDFTFFAAMIFVWMVVDSKKRGKNGWVWAPLMFLAPTIALAAYLLARGSTKDV